MPSICLVACVKSKAPKPSKARELYTSSLFKKTSFVANAKYDKWFILSAKYGLLSPDDIIAPYEQTLNHMTKEERVQWAKRVYSKLRNILNEDDEVIFFAGEKYRENLMPLLNKHKVIIPMEGMSIGYQLKWLNHKMLEIATQSDIEIFYQLLGKLEKGLGGKKNVSDLNGKSNIPSKGVYFFFEAGEVRANDKSILRVIRVGTHAVSKGSKASLWQRIKTHKGTINGRGNHRGSIFRLHVGNSILNKTNRLKFFPSWGIGQTGTTKDRQIEESIEKEVSSYISNLKLLWVEINDASGPQSDRAFIEKNAIALLTANKPTKDLPATNWIGKFSPKECIRDTGLWNINYVGGDYDPSFIEIFTTYVKATIGEIDFPMTSLAPKKRKKNITSLNYFQLPLF